MSRAIMNATARSNSSIIRSLIVGWCCMGCCCFMGLVAGLVMGGVLSGISGLFRPLAFPEPQKRNFLARFNQILNRGVLDRPPPADLRCCKPPVPAVARE